MVGNYWVKGVKNYKKLKEGTIEFSKTAQFVELFYWFSYKKFM